MVSRGRMIYAPKPLLDEIDDLKSENGLQNVGRGQAIIQLVKYAQTGREVERLWKFDFTKKKGWRGIRIDKF